MPGDRLLIAEISPATQKSPCLLISTTDSMHVAVATLVESDHRVFQHWKDGVADVDLQRNSAPIFSSLG